MKNYRSLPVINENNKCFDVHAKHKVSCRRTRCKNYIEESTVQNCVIVAAQNGPYTLQNIGKIYGLTRMRICQIEKSIIQKLRNFVFI